jgi:hypothetical protein
MIEETKDGIKAIRIARETKVGGWVKRNQERGMQPGSTQAQVTNVSL